jgi:hypothetical protein
MSVRRVRDALVAALGPDAHVEHRANHAGAGKLSFAVHLDGRRIWAKVSADADEGASLATWSRVADVLAERHAAPPVLDVLAVDGRTALLFPYIDAPVATRALLHERYDDARSVLVGLHSDDALADLLGAPTTTAACFREVWLERFVADLDVIEGYVAKDLHAYLSDEVDELGALVDTLDAPARSPVHGDPWHENFLVAPDRLWLLDWEDLAIGDPALDDAILRHDAVGTDPDQWPEGPVHAVARRALMLDSVIDVAADWVEAGVLAGGDPQVRRRKETTYLAGLEAYRTEAWVSS